MVYKKRDDLKKVQLLASSYYSRKNIQRAIFDFCKNRETIPRYLDGFGKRPDCFDYPNDILNMAKKGATSFHCSEEIWQDPLKVSTNMNAEEYNEIRTGWDFLIDIDSKYLDYSKIAAELLIKEIENHNIKNYGIKFSGSKGFHIIVPFKAFPAVFANESTKDKFPEWPRLIADYLFNRIKEPMNRKIILMSGKENLEKSGELISENFCTTCGKSVIRKKVGVYKCPNFRCRTEVKSMKSNRKEMICPSCNDKMQRVNEEEIFYCNSCNRNFAILEIENSKYQTQSFESHFREETNKSTENSVDIVLVASRHLFRAPYSLHEKTSLASIVINKEDIENFKPADADPLKIKEPKSFMPDSVAGEARELLFQAIDNARKQEIPEKKYDGQSIDLKGLKITQEMFPPIIKKILKGIKTDGRKRALYILLSFFNSLDFPQGYIHEKVLEWNKKNYNSLKEGYLKSQLDWFSKRKILPPNYDKPIYKEFGLDSSIETKIKNPINYTIKKALQLKNKSNWSDN